MPIYIFFWSLLFLIAIVDLKENKIPNVLLILLFTFQVLTLYTTQISILNFILGGVVLFSGAFALFYIRAMSPGDVKLLGVVGFCVGFDSLGTCVFWIILASGLVGGLFVLYNFSFLGINNPMILINEPKLYTRVNSNVGNTNPWRYGDKLTMPFAPSVMIGLALFYYFN
ncbi:prepilin peptidase [Vibrio neonatus]|uniref:prepilin peptidase n=1 Tax=Vibrio neonatus TaxID=278860 RepID=UPI0021C34634|nr:A24 family peptidase [Vibrio neonatus]